jgi:VanZ family protein
MVWLERWFVPLSRTALFLYLTLLFYISLRPVGTGPVSGASSSLLYLHIIAYAALSFLAITAYPLHFRQQGPTILAAVFAIGIGIELMQIPVQGRFFSVLDIAANGAGIIPFYLFREYLHRLHVNRVVPFYRSIQ